MRITNSDISGAVPPSGHKQDRSQGYVRKGRTFASCQSEQTVPKLNDGFCSFSMPQTLHKGKKVVEEPIVNSGHRAEDRARLRMLKEGNSGNNNSMETFGLGPSIAGIAQQLKSPHGPHQPYAMSTAAVTARGGAGGGRGKTPVAKGGGRFFQLAGIINPAPVDFTSTTIFVQENKREVGGRREEVGEDEEERNAKNQMAGLSRTLVRAWIRAARAGVNQRAIKEAKRKEDREKRARKEALKVQEELERKVRLKKLTEERELEAVNARLEMLRVAELERRNRVRIEYQKENTKLHNEFELKTLASWHETQARVRSMASINPRVIDSLPKRLFIPENKDTRTWQEIARVSLDIVKHNVPKESDVTAFVKQVFGIDQKEEPVEAEEEESLTDLSSNKTQKSKGKKVKGKKGNPRKSTVSPGKGTKSPSKAKKKK